MVLRCQVLAVDEQRVNRLRVTFDLKPFLDGVQGGR